VEPERVGDLRGEVRALEADDADPCSGDLLGRAERITGGFQQGAQGGERVP
jgi:hypothetical protein